MLKLPSSYSQKKLLIDEEEVPTLEKIKKWKYLDSIRKYLPSDSSDGTVGILIGSNCSNALEQIEVIPSQLGGPYGFKTRLGWCIMGRIAKENSAAKTVCNKIAVQDVFHNNIASHYFCVPSEVKDQLTIEILQAMYKHDFSECGD